MSLSVRLEVSNLATDHISGVGHYTRLLGEALSQSPDITFNARYFNFLNRQPEPSVSFVSSLGKNPLVPLRVYAHLHEYGIAPPFDAFLSRADLTIFPNFARWPTLRSRLAATVIHDLTFLKYPDAVERKNLVYLRRVVPRAIRQSDFVITVSESMKREIMQTFTISSEKCVVTPIPPDPIFFNPVSDAAIAQARQRYGLGPKPYIYFIGNREPRKNLLTLIEAYELLPQTIRDRYDLVLAGGSGWKSESVDAALHDAVTRGAAIKQIGYVDQPDSPALYQGASLFVMPSLYEGFGMPVLEAFASGCPVVASDIAVLREVGGTSASYADPNDPTSFGRAIEQALTTPPPDTQTLQKAAHAYSWADNIARIAAKTNTILSQS